MCKLAFVAVGKVLGTESQKSTTNNLKIKNWPLKILDSMLFDSMLYKINKMAGGKSNLEAYLQVIKAK